MSDSGASNRKRRREERDGTGGDQDADSTKPRFVDGTKIPRAKVRESGNENSCSIEETNRIRAAIGLPPLVVSSSKQNKAEEDARARREAHERAEKTAKLEAALERAKKKRELAARLPGKGLGESLLETGKHVGSAADWVKNDRKRSKAAKRAAKLMAAKRAALMDEQDDATTEYSSKDLSGLAIRHDLRSFEEGSEVVLTLADKSILDDKGEALADNPDELVNVNLVDSERTKELKDRKAKAARPVYSAYDDDEFDEDGNFKKKSLLNQYDEEAKSGPALVIGARGTIQAKPKSIEDPMEPKKIGTDLTAVQKKQAAEFYTKEEMVQFAKPKRRKKKKMRKRATAADAIDGDEDETRMEGVAVNDGEQDHGTRRHSVKLSRQAKTEAKVAADKARAYNTALAKASSDGKHDDPAPPVTSKTGGAAKKVEKTVETSFSGHRKYGFMEDDDGDTGAWMDDDDDLQATLARARTLADAAARKKAKREAAEEPLDMDDGGADAVASTLEAAKDQIRAREHASSGSGVSFTSTLDFTRRVKARMDEQAAAAARKEASAKSTESAMELDGGAEDDVKEGPSDGEGEGEEEEDIMGEVPESEVTEDTDAAFTSTRNTVGGGVGRALQLLRRQGDLGVKEIVSGRVNDKRFQDEDDPAPGIKLEYKDAYGRKLTRKEAFRQLSYKFHGSHPGKRKQVKMRELYNEQVKAQQRSGSVSASKGMIGALQKTQRAKGQAFVVMPGSRR